MWHLLSHPHASDAGQSRPGVGSVGRAAAPVLDERDVIPGAAAPAMPPALPHHHWPGAMLLEAVHHIHIALPDPRPMYPRREAGYSEAARMSRQMDHL